MKRKLWLLICGTLIVSMVLAACASPEAPAEVEKPAAEEAAAEPIGEPIKIGASMPLTGGFAIPGQKHADGYELCVDKINEKGGLLGRPVELIITDNQSDVDTILAQTERLINVDKVDLIFGTFSSKLTFPQTSITEQAQMVNPIPSGAAVKIYARGFDYIFYFQQLAAEYVGRSPINLINDLVDAADAPTSVAVVYADDFFAGSIANGLLGGEVDTGEEVVQLPALLEDAGMAVVYEEMWPEEGFADWITLANSMKASGAEFVVGLTASPDEAVLLTRAMQTVDYNPKGVYLSQGTQIEYYEGVGEAANGVMIHAAWHSAVPWEGLLADEVYGNQDFQADFEAAFGRAADEDEAIPFALCQGMEQAVRATGTTDNTVLRDWFAARTADDPVKTIIGDRYWDETGLPIDANFVMTQWQDGELEFVYPVGEFPGTVDVVWPKPAWSTAVGLSESGGLLDLNAGSCDYGGKIQQITALDSLTVKFNLCKPDPAFLAKAAFTPFGVQPREWIEETGGGGDILDNPVGTGPWALKEWARGDSITYSRFEDYWGDQPVYDTLVFRWATEGAARLLELQSGTVDQITNLSPDDFTTVQNDSSLTFIPVANPNILYLAMTNTFTPFDDVKVRQAIGMGIDRQRIVDNFYPEGSEVASHFTPCSIPNGCTGDAWYDFDPEAAQALLAEAGYPDGFESSIFYRDVFRGYLPEPGLVAVEFQTQLRDNLGIEVDVVVMESGEFIDESTQGNLDGFYLLGWGADYPHVTNFLDFHFSAANPQYGETHPEIYEVLEQASQIGDPAEAEALYTEANNAIRELAPMVPIAHGASASAALASVDNAHFRPFGAPLFHYADPGKDTFVFMQNAEPISLYCADETDGESLAPCQQVVEPLYDYEIDSGNVRPILATSCEPNDDLTAWTCALREGVKFHDGSDLDANDVVMSWAAAIDAGSPYHVGNTGAFEYYAYLWDGLMDTSQ